MVGAVCPVCQCSLASVQSSQQSEPECEGREVPCSQPRVPSLLTSVAGVCQSPPPSLDLSGLPPPSALTLGAGARAGAGLNWPLCPLRWTQIRGPAQRTDRQYNLDYEYEYEFTSCTHHSICYSTGSKVG